MFNHFLNPPVYAKIEEDKIVFKSNEKVQIFNIKNIEYFEDLEIELAANGFRWGNDDYILIQLKESNKSYIFNFDKTDKTTVFYDPIIQLFNNQ
ncbi:MAG: hypothetical protein ACI317_01815 [Floccifex porci]|uniref:hypothetical protein n=1 Tax=Floccifex porci TaxID=2606629 RepID=UPI003EFC6C53